MNYQTPSPHFISELSTVNYDPKKVYLKKLERRESEDSDETLCYLSPASAVSLGSMTNFAGHTSPVGEFLGNILAPDGGEFETSVDAYGEKNAVQRKDSPQTQNDAPLTPDNIMTSSSGGMQSPDWLDNYISNSVGKNDSLGRESDSSGQSVPTVTSKEPQSASPVNTSSTNLAPSTSTKSITVKRRDVAHPGKSTIQNLTRHTPSGGAAETLCGLTPSKQRSSQTQHVTIVKSECTEMAADNTTSTMNWLDHYLPSNLRGNSWSNFSKGQGSAFGTQRSQVETINAASIAMLRTPSPASTIASSSFSPPPSNVQERVLTSGNGDRAPVQSPVKCKQSSSPGGVSSTSPGKRQTPQELCQVCGDTASGFHCGAFICEACKKFFLRSLKQDSSKYSCPKNGDCVITKETRTSCQQCRFQRCRELKLYKPGCNPNGEKGMQSIPCGVCKSPSTGYHFGAITCEGCKGFFRRMIKEREGSKYSCSRGGNCIITPATRSLCKHCRFKQCLLIGMSPDASRIGRQPNALKHATMVQYQHIKREADEKPNYTSQQQTHDQTDVSLANAEEAQQGVLNSGSRGTGITDSEVENPGFIFPASTSATATVPSNDMQATDNAGAGKPFRASLGEQAVKTNLQRGHYSAFNDRRVSGNGAMPGGPPVSSGLSAPVEQLSPGIRAAAAQGLYMDSSLGPATGQLAGNSSLGAAPVGHPVNPSLGAQTTRLSNNTSLGASALPWGQAINADFGGGLQSGNPDCHVVPGLPPAKITSETLVLPSPAKTRKVQTERAEENGPVTVSVEPQQRSPSLSQTSGNPHIFLHPKPPLHATTSQYNNTENMDEHIKLWLTSMQSGIVELKKMNIREPYLTELTDFSVDGIWTMAMKHFEIDTNKTLKFAKLLPGWRAIPLDLQIVLIQQGLYPIVVLMLSMAYNGVDKSYNFFNMTELSKKKLTEMFPPFRILHNHFINVGEMVHEVNFDDMEIAFICAILLVGSLPAREEVDTEGKKLLQTMEAEVLKSFQYYLQKKENGFHRFGMLLLRIGELRLVAYQHSQASKQVKELLPRLMSEESDGQLFNEIYGGEGEPE